ncbi:hypothetical protein C1645_775917 [Glomus cerebriforme]|uniref:Uncharacterized protein n=1 Tax=Glomus cerebriforme TaxID=658196 RepID=A0A397ST09_9GLOM|nr:hypothetical protein C1645_775917 [Glomus cerebriforme]
MWLFLFGPVVPVVFTTEHCFYVLLITCYTNYALCFVHMRIYVHIYKYKIGKVSL